MHIPDGFLDTKTIAVTSVLAAAGVSRALRNVSRRADPRQIPLMGLAAAFVFVAQMLNFPVLGGTSGHLLGGVLIAVLLGLDAAVVVMTIVLVVQCLLFADGGLLALGANIFNMAIVATVAGYAVYAGVRRVLPTAYGRFVGAACAAWASTVFASVCCTGELVWSGTVAWELGIPAMSGIHMLIGAGEAVITGLVLVALTKLRPELLDAGSPGSAAAAGTGWKDVLIHGSLLTIALALFVAPFASGWPDGLETVAAALGFDTRALSVPVLPAPVADYRVPGIGSLPVATALAGVVGAVLVFGVSLAVFRAVQPKSLPRRQE